MRLLVDMNLSPRWTKFLQSHGFEAAHWSEVGASTATDTEIMDVARREGLIVLTHDLDFGAILAASGDTAPSVVQVRADNLSPEAIGTEIVEALQQLREDLSAGSLVTIEPGRPRARLLPIRKSD